MGVDYQGQFVFGAKVPVGLVTVVEQWRNCLHDMPSDAKYCPTCGAKRGSTPKERIPFWAEGDFRVRELDGLDVVTEPNMEKYFVVGRAIGQSLSLGDSPISGPVKIPDHAITKSELCPRIEEWLKARTGLDPKNPDIEWGYWFVIQVSY